MKSRLQTIEIARGRNEAVEMCAVEEGDGEEKICDKAAGGFVISIDASSEIKKLLVAGGVAVSSSVSPALQCWMP